MMMHFVFFWRVEEAPTAATTVSVPALVLGGWIAYPITTATRQP